MMNLFALNTLITASLLFAISIDLSAQEIECDYFGLSRPGIQPEDFNPEILDLNGSFKFNVEIRDCESVFFTTIDAKENIYFSKKHNGNWSTPEIASFSDPNYSDADPYLNEAGDRIFFISQRPTSSSDENPDWNIWSADEKDGKWATPKPLPYPINTDDANEYFFSISEKGNAFFSSNRAGGEGSFDIYVTKVLDNDQYSEPENIGRPVSTEKYEFDPYIAPDESFIIYSINENGNASLFYSHKNDKGEWMEPKNLGDDINVTNQDFAPSLSADGSLIFFSNDGKLRWVSSEILD